MVAERAPEPRKIYLARLAEREALLARLERRDARISQARGICFLLFAGLGVAAWIDRLPSWACVVPLLAFVVLVVVHDRLARARGRARRAVEHLRDGLARLDEQWAGRGVQAQDYLDEGDHPYAADLDLFGRGSLFELLCRARTRAGEETLARWLAGPFGGLGDELPARERVAILRRRQQSVKALIDRLDLREDLALLGDDLRVEVRPRSLIAWASAPAVPSAGLARLWRIGGVVVPVLAVAGVVAWAIELGPWLLVLAGLIAGGVYRASKDALERIAGPLDRSSHELSVLAGLLARLERESFEDPDLRALVERLRGSGSLPAASVAIARLRRLGGFYEAQRNALFFPFALLLLWGPNFAAAIERWRIEQGPRVAEWIGALGQLEALASLASHAFENPDDPFPTLVEDPGTRLIGEQLGHPLLARRSCVCNSLALGDPLRAYVISGSNMSGKSTFLRTVGVNVVLALAGGPIRGERLELSPLRIGATLRVQDSLQEGHSRFWAELARLRTISELASQGPLLFLLDEIFHGTNSHDRRIGAEALLRSLIERGAIGLLTTHDLALAQAAEALAPSTANVHFQDEFVDGRLVFDYRMRPGVVERSNALALMRSVGLEVGIDPAHTPGP